MKKLIDFKLKETNHATTLSLFGFLRKATNHRASLQH